MSELHFLVTHSSKTGTTTIGDSFKPGFPFGIEVKPNGSPVVFDFEFAPEKVTLYPDDFRARERWYREYID